MYIFLPITPAILEDPSHGKHRPSTRQSTRCHFSTHTSHNLPGTHKPIPRHNNLRMGMTSCRAHAWDSATNFPNTCRLNSSYTSRTLPWTHLSRPGSQLESEWVSFGEDEDEAPGSRVRADQGSVRFQLSSKSLSAGVRDLSTDRSHGKDQSLSKGSHTLNTGEEKRKNTGQKVQRPVRDAISDYCWSVRWMGKTRGETSLIRKICFIIFLDSCSLQIAYKRPISVPVRIIKWNKKYLGFTSPFLLLLFCICDSISSKLNQIAWSCVQFTILCASSSFELDIFFFAYRRLVFFSVYCEATIWGSGPFFLLAQGFL